MLSTGLFNSEESKKIPKTVFLESIQDFFLPEEKTKPVFENFLKEIKNSIEKVEIQDNDSESTFVEKVMKKIKSDVNDKDFKKFLDLFEHENFETKVEKRIKKEIKNNSRKVYEEDEDGEDEQEEAEENKGSEEPEELKKAKEKKENIENKIDEAIKEQKTVEDNEKEAIEQNDEAEKNEKDKKELLDQKTAEYETISLEQKNYEEKEKIWKEGLKKLENYQEEIKKIKTRINGIRDKILFELLDEEGELNIDEPKRSNNDFSAQNIYVLEGTLKDMELREDSLKNSAGEAEKEFNKAKKDLEDKKKNNHDLLAQIEKAKTEYDNALVDHETAKNNSTEKESSLKAISQKKEEAEKKIKELRAELDKVEARIESLEKEDKKGKLKTKKIRRKTNEQNKIDLNNSGNTGLENPQYKPDEDNKQQENQGKNITNKNTSKGEEEDKDKKKKIIIWSLSAVLLSIIVGLCIYKFVIREYMYGIK